MTESQIKEIKRLLAECAKEHRKEIFQFLREEFPIHSFEKKLNIDAEIILEAIDRAQDITLRGLRGIIAELAFSTKVKTLDGWKELPLAGEHAYDFLLTDGAQVRVQVKLQRQRRQRPMLASEASRVLPSDMYVVEVQRTRTGKDSQTGQNTRPYRFGEFDILAVSLQPSTNEWNRFAYTVDSWLLPRPDDEKLIRIFQPVATHPNDDWTDDFPTAVSWFRSGKKKRIYAGENVSSKRSTEKRNRI